MVKLQLKNVYKKYPKSKEYAVESLSFEAEEGEFLSILGPSGCGKTTTMRMIAGLEEITNGEIYIGGRKINDIPPADRKVGLAFENYALYTPLTVYENLAFPLRAKKVPEQEVDKRVKRIASLIGIEHILDKKPRQLVEGDMQKLNIGRTLVKEPEIILLDEPMSHLDRQTRQYLRHEIKNIHNEIKATSILVTHDQLEALSLADRVVIMNKGKLQQIGTPKEVYDDPTNEFVAGFIGEPPMNLFEVKVVEEDNKLYFSFPETKIKLEVPEKYQKVLKGKEAIKLGIRPTDIFISSEGFPVKVDIVENIGEEQRISIMVGKGEFLIFIKDRTFDVSEGEKIKIRLDPEKTHVFDVETGEKIKTI